MARTHKCSLSGIELEAFTLFKLFKGAYGPASEFEFHLQPSKAEWIRLVHYLRKFSQPSLFKDQFN